MDTHRVTLRDEQFFRENALENEKETKMKNCNQRRNATRRDQMKHSAYTIQRHVWNGAKKRDQVGTNGQQEIRGGCGAGHFVRLAQNK